MSMPILRLSARISSSTICPTGQSAGSHIQQSGAISYALTAFRRAFRKGVLYKKAGVVLLKIIPESAVVPDLFDEKDRDKDSRLQRVLDHIDDRHGKRAIILGSQMRSGDSTTVYRNEHKSPLYTTDLRDILTVKTK